MLRNFFTVMGVIFVCLIAAALIAFAIFGIAGSGLDKESKAYVDAALPAILASWEPLELINRSSPELFRMTAPDKITSLFQMFREKLGKLKKYEGSHGNSGFHLTPQGVITTASYAAKAVCEKSEAMVMITLIRRNKEWQVFEFRVNADAFAE